ncbi:MAG: hypothetical protein ABIP61_16140, partial [Burkholderiaceae bacterium]
MKRAAGVPWWAEFALRRAPNFTETTDRADMGTAFGLDASFPAEDEPPEADASTPAETAPKPWE